jgi:hypothetical protein
MVAATGLAALGWAALGWAALGWAALGWAALGWALGLLAGGAASYRYRLYCCIKLTSFVP